MTLRVDGHITVYVIKHVHPSTISNGWDGVTWQNSGDCAGFERRQRDMSLFDPFKASGDVWQQYGVHATFDKALAQKAAFDMHVNFPEYHFSVHELELLQKTKLVTAILIQPK